MATREGIYVGGHEIIERYVGSRLVWEKFVLITKEKITRHNKYGEKSNELHFFIVASFASTLDTFLEPTDSIAVDGTLFTKITIKFLSEAYRGNNLKVLEFRLTFSDAKDKDALVSIINSHVYEYTTTFETKFYKKKR